MWAIIVASCLTSPAEWFASGYIGGVHTQSSDLFLQQNSLATNLTFHRMGYTGHSFQGPLYYGARGGYFFGGHWGLEAEYTHLKVFANVQEPVRVGGVLNGAPIDTVQPADPVLQRFSISHGVNLLLANVVFRQQFWRQGTNLGRFLFNFRVGEGATIPHPESIIEGNTDQHYQIGRPAFAAAAGAEFRIWRRVYWQAEYKYTRTRQRVDVFSGMAETLLESHHLLTGPMVHF